MEIKIRYLISEKCTGVASTEISRNKIFNTLEEIKLFPEVEIVSVGEDFVTVEMTEEFKGRLVCQFGSLFDIEEVVVWQAMKEFLAVFKLG